MRIKALSLVFALCFCFVFCGCAFVKDNDDMVSPPELTGEMAPIAKALYAVAGDDCNLEYPSDGDYRSAIVLEDINGDGVFEAFAFYSTSDDEMVTMHINLIGRVGDEWKSLDDKTMIAAGVEKIEFSDFNKDGSKEIVVGWDINGTSEKQLTVFKFNQNTLSQQLLQPYTSFLTCDLDDDGANELFVHQLNVIDKTNNAKIYKHQDNKLSQTADCIMDSGVKSASKPILSTLSNGKKAIYIDESLGVEAITEVLFFNDGVLANPLLKTEDSSKEYATKRAGSISTQDIDGDGVLDIPVRAELPNAQNNDEKLYYTNWCTYDGQTLSVKRYTVVNTVDGYFLTVPNNLLGNIAVTKDLENRQRRFYHYKDAEVGEALFTITAVSTAKWDGGSYDKGNKKEIMRANDTVFAVEIESGADAFGISFDSIKGSFNLVA